MKYIITASCFTILIAASCKKHKPPKTELEKLPPITQNGANTFGCLLNGVAWIPKDNYGQPTFKLDVDPNLGNGIFVLSAVRYQGTNSTSFAIGSVACTNAGTYNFSNSGQVFSYSNSELLCSYDNNTAGVYKSGSFTIIRYDLTNRIFSGTLHFTNGRFDKKL